MNEKQCSAQDIMDDVVDTNEDESYVLDFLGTLPNITKHDLSFLRKQMGIINKNNKQRNREIEISVLNSVQIVMCD